MSIMKLILKDKKDLFLITFFMLIANFLAQAVPYTIKFLSDGILKMDLLIVVFVAIGLVVIGVIRYFSDFLSDRFYFKFTDKLGYIMLKDFLQAIVYSRNGLMLEFNPDTLSRIALSDIDQLKRVILNQYFVIVSTVLQSCTLAIFVVMIDWKLGLITILWYTLFFFGTRALLNTITIHQTKERKTYSKIITFIKDSIFGSFELKYYADSKIYLEKFDRMNDEYIANDVNAQSSASLFRYLSHIGNFMNIAIIMLYGALNPVSVSVGTLFALYMYSANYSDIFSSIMHVLSNKKKIAVMQKPINDFYDAVKRNKAVNTIPCGKISQVAIKNLTVAYEEKKILDNFNYDFIEGKTYFINGKSGSGKTSLINALLGEVKYEGEIKYNENDLSALDHETFCSRIGIIKQNIYLFNTDIKNNIALFNNKYTTENIQKAADFVSIPNLEHEIGTSEIEKVSGGERKRIALARLLLCIESKDVIILDETFANIDLDTIKVLVKEIIELTKNKILIVITHDDAVRNLFSKENVLEINLGSA